LTVLKEFILIICASHCSLCDFINLTRFSFLIIVSNFAFVFILHVSSLSCVGPYIFLKTLVFIYSRECSSPVFIVLLFTNSKMYLT
jgi:hypothetical protein